ncbi:MAG TPA: SDR family oxidoreductase [Thermoanaerobaculia bacterium]|nr:SDR family oxidoreductase [Thermoanaerobaculia bacterium]
MNLLVGSTGFLGGRIARQLLANGAPLRVLARSGTTELAGAEAVQGDLKDRASLDAACRGVSTVITSANSAQRGGGDNVTTVDSEGNMALIDAARAAGVRRFIFISAAAVHEASPVPLFAAKARAERHLRDSGMEWTVVAPHVFMDVWFPAIVGSALAAGQPVALVGGGKRRQSFIAVDDVAAFTVAAVDNPAAANRRLLIGGPAALSWSEVVDLTSSIAGRPVPSVTIEPGAPIPTLPPPADQFMGNLAAGLEQQDVVFDTSELARELGVTLTPAETVLRRMLAG